MPERERSSQTQVWRLDTLVRKLAAGRFGVPPFQRGYVWTDTQILELAESIWQGFPFGPLLLWDRQDSQGVRPLVEGLPLKEDPQLIVDGQQRLGAIARLFHVEGRLFGVNLENGTWREYVRPPEPPNVLGRDLIDLNIYTLQRLFGRTWSVEDEDVASVIRASERIRDHQVITIEMDRGCSASFVVGSFIRLAKNGTPICEDDLKQALSMLEPRGDHPAASGGFADGER